MKLSTKTQDAWFSDREKGVAEVHKRKMADLRRWLDEVLSEVDVQAICEQVLSEIE